MKKILEIKKLVTEGQIESAINCLLNITNSNSTFNDIVLLSSRYSILKKSIRDGVISIGESTISQNIISKSVIELCDIIENDVSILKSQKSSVQLIDCTIIESYENLKLFRQSWLNQEISEVGYFPIIDIKVLNPTDEIVLINEVTIKAKLLNKERNFKFNAAKEISWEYSICLDPSKEQEELDLSLSQVIKPNDVDRFIIMIGHKGLNMKSVEYEMQLTFKYNVKFEFESKIFKLKIFGTDLLGDNRKTGIHSISLN